MVISTNVSFYIRKEKKNAKMGYGHMEQSHWKASYIGNYFILVQIIGGFGWFLGGGKMEKS